ncbi:cob(I)yrinic acid a,c-diamide adenosyltransferase [Candidatus Nitrososphaera evergladensis SR1]|uniref:Cob(I)yrinic acid a,c-diamide adenosyltransferase n=1 Tax=Candidatus Nitrososphaera evergladensis SR1 TaxID=1459636 RepID=A0A075MSP0_9ARCH|nr:cob(I)yrinic acid a,c-diamide adenosyltransferase [Candidatus Nitrososphaera evergladensis]AIF83797.1 cob(I)yrinic acid a,c-diamide adenosyltransferase [Candidatus Nitrososphaera evergladensis SR1]
MPPPPSLDRAPVIVYTGKGKGKTTAALGIVLRAVGHGHKVGMIQFIKGEWYYGELTSSKRLEPEFEMIAAGKGFVGIIDDDHPIEEHQKASQDAVGLVRDKLASGAYDVMILDEVNYAVKLGLITVDDVLGIIAAKPDKTTLVLTGNHAHEKVLEAADLVTEMREVKHPFQKGIKARKGIDF